jgi:hypothetical protein
MRLARRWALVGGLLSGSAAIFATASPVAAECAFFDPWPSFRATVPTADRIVIGTVVGSYGRTSAGGHTVTFEFHVDEVVRGSSDPVIGFREGVRSGAPVTCPDSLLRPRVGDVLALAFDATLPEYPDPVLGAAFIPHASQWDKMTMPGIEGITRGRVRALAALPQAPATDVEPVIESPGSTPPAASLGLLGLLGGAMLLVGRRWALEDADR